MRRLHIIITLLLLALAAALGGCRQGHDARLDRAAALADSLPDSALTLLRAIDPEPLGRADRARHALLLVKATDKAYLTHDSLSYARLRLAMDYYRSHGTPLERAEVLYYAGRLAADSLHYATALIHFDDARTTLESADHESVAAKRLLSSILSQKAQILTEMGLKREAAPFFKEAIEASASVADTAAMAADFRTLAFNYIGLQEFEQADSCIGCFERLYLGLVAEDIALCEVIKRYRRLEENNYYGALVDIDSLINVISPSFNSFAENIAIKAYSEVGGWNKAIGYARDIVARPISSNKYVAYKVLIKDLIRGGDVDLASRLLVSQMCYVDTIYGRYEHNKSLIPKGFYEGMIAERNLTRLERHYDRLIFITVLVALLLIAAVLAFISLRLKSRLKSEELKVKEKDIAMLNCRISYLLGDKDDKGENADELRNQLIASLIERESQKFASAYEYSGRISFRTALRAVEEKRLVRDDEWEIINKDIEDMVPGFTNSLRLLFPSINSTDLRICRLIKIGFTTSQIALSVGRAKSSVSSSKAKLNNLIVADNMGADNIDGLIPKL